MCNTVSNVLKMLSICSHLDQVGCEATPKCHDAFVLDHLPEAVCQPSEVDISPSTMGQVRTLSLERKENSIKYDVAKDLD